MKVIQILEALIGQTVSIKNRRFPNAQNVCILSIVLGTRVMKASYHPLFPAVYVCEAELNGGATYPHSPEEQARAQRILNQP